jgi:hypothetical protein
MKSSPWGAVQTEQEYAAGVTFVSTAGHGGFHLAGPALDVAKRQFPKFKPFAGWPWLEEDCDAVLVFLLYPHLFEPKSVKMAIELASKDEYYTGVKEWLNSPAAVPTHNRAALVQ